MDAVNDDGMIYELNKDYHIDGDVTCKLRGYHYFESLRDCMLLYNLKESRVFECVLEGDKFDYLDSVHCTNHIRLTRELTQEEIIQYIEDNLNELIKDRWNVRRNLAPYGLGLNVLVNDGNEWVRKEVANKDMD